MCNVLRGSTVDKCKTLTETENSMTLKQVYDQFMDVAEYGHLHIEAFKMTKEFYIKLLNSDLKKDLYVGGLRISLHYSNPCQVMIHGYPILISKDFKEEYAFEVIPFITIEEEYIEMLNKDKNKLFN